MSDQNIRIILSLAKNRMKPTLVGYDLYLHRNTVMYHIEKIREITGLDPLDFYDLCKLLKMAEERKDNG